jgi:hypothetical protein
MAQLLSAVVTTAIKKNMIEEILCEPTQSQSPRATSRGVLAGFDGEWRELIAVNVPSNGSLDKMPLVVSGLS